MLRKKQCVPVYREHAQIEGLRTLYTDLMTLGHDEDFDPRQPAEATAAPPGSLEKIEVMARRIELGQPIWCDDDVQSHDDHRVTEAARNGHNTGSRPRPATR